jgi:hypothetical protein
MTWVRLDDAVMSHPKMLTLDPLSFSLWVGGLAYANRHATDGAIPEKALWGLVPGAWKVASRALNTAAKSIVDASLWSRTETGWSIVNYSTYQEEALSERVEERREANKRYKRAEREREKQRESSIGQHLTHADSQANVRSDKLLTVRSDVSTGQSLTSAASPGDSRADAASLHAEEATKETSRSNVDAEKQMCSGPVEAKKGTVNVSFLQGNLPMSGGPAPSRPVPSKERERASEEVDPIRRTREFLIAEYEKAPPINGIAIGTPGDLFLPVFKTEGPLYTLSKQREDLLRAVMPAFFADQRAREEGYPLAFLAKNVNQYLAKLQAPSGGSSVAGRPSTLADYEHLALNREEQLKRGERVRPPNPEHLQSAKAKMAAAQQAMAS